MASELKNIVKHTKIYGLGNILNRAAGLVLLPVYVNVLTPDEYGLYSLVAITMEIVSVLLVMGLGNTLVRFYVNCKNDIERHEIVSTAFIFYLILSVVFLLFSDLLATVTCNILFGNDTNHAFLYYGYWAMIFTGLFNIQLQYLGIDSKKTCQGLLKQYQIKLPAPKAPQNPTSLLI